MLIMRGDADLAIVNGMVWYRPTAAEMNKLQDLGNTGWNWTTLEPVSYYFIPIKQWPDGIGPG